jgi:hypothetical protein
VRVVVDRDFGIELMKQESIIKVKVVSTNGSLVSASSVSTRRALK